MTPLRARLEALRPALATAAQQVIDEWQVDEDGLDPVFGAGGACDAVANAMREVICNHFEDVRVLDGGQDGDDHAWLIALDASEAIGLDIPPGVYETGGGYSWTKIEGAKVDPLDVVLFDLDRSDMEDADEDCW